MKQYQQYFGLTGVGKSTRWGSSLPNGAQMDCYETSGIASCLEFSLCSSFHVLKDLECSNNFCIERTVVLSGR